MEKMAEINILSGNCSHIDSMSSVSFADQNDKVVRVRLGGKNTRTKSKYSVEKENDKVLVLASPKDPRSYKNKEVLSDSQRIFVSRIRDSIVDEKKKSNKLFRTFKSAKFWSLKKKNDGYYSSDDNSIPDDDVVPAFGVVSKRVGYISDKPPKMNGVSVSMKISRRASTQNTELSENKGAKQKKKIEIDAHKISKEKKNRRSSSSQRDKKVKVIRARKNRTQ